MRLPSCRQERETSSCSTTSKGTSTGDRGPVWDHLGRRQTAASPRETSLERGTGTMTNSDMTCEAFDTALPDYLEGTLDGSLRASVERHLRECVRCAGLVRDIENIRDEAAALPDLVPSHDLWAGIEARIAAPVIPLAARPERQKRLVPAWMGIAAAALIVSTAGVTYFLTARSFRSGGDARVAIVAPPLQAQTTDASAPKATTAVAESVDT